MVTRLRSVRWLSPVVIALNVLLVAASARAQAPEASEAPKASEAPEPSPPTPPRTFPVLHHTPLTVAPANEPLVFEADIDAPELVRRAMVVYRTPQSEVFRAVELLRSPGPTAYSAKIPGEWVHAPSISYAIELDLVDGKRIAAFATREQPHDVAITDDYNDLWERAMDTRLDHRRSVASMLAEYVSFGGSDVIPAGATNPVSVSDYYYRVEGGFTYRPLRILTEFTVRLGVLRGNAPTRDGETAVGINYTAPSVRFRLADICYADIEGLAGVTEVGFELGGGGQILVGDPLGSKVAVGLESINEFGLRIWSRVDIAATERFTVSPIVEATNLPHADDYGVRLLLELAANVGAGFNVTLNGGYEARQATSGGPSGALKLSYAF